MQRVRWSRNIEQHAAKKATSLVVVALRVPQKNNINSTQNEKKQFIAYNDNVAFGVVTFIL